jgi:8-oxo-dGTP pyrophosphatase MutT (NUDIX family)
MQLNDEVVEGIPKDAASVVLLRDGSAGLEVFLLRRGQSTTVMNSAYVFPGGKVDPADGLDEQTGLLNLGGSANLLLGEPATDDRTAKALYVAACRETFEESGVRLYAPDLIPFSRWITPKVPAMMRKRFDTRFFFAELPDGANAIHDGQEADASAWYGVRQALEHCRDRKINMAPPQIMTLLSILPQANYAALAASLAAHVPRLIEPFSLLVDGVRTITYPGDPRHPVADRAMPGPTALIYKDEYFVPEAGFDSYF